MRWNEEEALLKNLIILSFILVWSVSVKKIVVFKIFRCFVLQLIVLKQRICCFVKLRNSFYDSNLERKIKAGVRAGNTVEHPSEVGLTRCTVASLPPLLSPLTTVHHAKSIVAEEMEYMPSVFTSCADGLSVCLSRLNGSLVSIAIAQLPAEFTSSAEKAPSRRHGAQSTPHSQTRSQFVC